MSTRGLLYSFGIGGLMVMGVYLAVPSHADPDICGTGKFYNQYSNECIPTDRGAYPNYPPYNPSYGPDPGRYGY